jgi:hypothetical protein
MDAKLEFEVDAEGPADMMDGGEEGGCVANRSRKFRPELIAMPALRRII